MRDASTTLVRSLLAAVPYIGGALNEVFFDHRSRVKQRRLESFLIGLGEQVVALRAESEFQSRLLDEQFGDLFESAAARAARTSDESKHERLRKVLIRQLPADSEPTFDELFLDLIAELSDKEIEILSAFRDASIEAAKREVKAAQLPLDGPFRAAVHYSLTESNFNALLGHLLSRGLLYDDAVGRFGGGSRIYELTELGHMFLRFLESPRISS